MLLLSACTVIDAPETLEELAVFGFVNYTRPGYADAFAETMPELSDLHRDGLTEGYYVDSLTGSDLSAAGVEAPDVTDIIGAMGSVTYRHGLEDVLDILTAENKDELFDTYPAYDVYETTDRDCFLAGECPTLVQQILETTEVVVLGEATRDYTLEFSWTEDETGNRGVLARSLCPEPMTFSTEIAAVYQQYQLYAVYPDGGETRRDEAFWADAEFFGVDVPTSFAVDSAIDTMGTQAARVDDAIDALAGG